MYIGRGIFKILSQDTICINKEASFKIVLSATFVPALFLNISLHVNVKYSKTRRKKWLLHYSLSSLSLQCDICNDLDGVEIVGPGLGSRATVAAFDDRHNIA